MEQPSSAGQNSELLANLLKEKYEPIAIVGIGLHLPGGNHSVDEFREFLRRGGDAIIPIPADRWNNADYYSEQGGGGKIRTNRGGYLADIRGFDPKFFNISPKEADYIDPQQRLVLETAWEALEHAQIDPAAAPHRDGAVFVGISSIDYSLEIDALHPTKYEAHIGTGTAHSAAAGRVSYFLGWRGPCISIDTACSSSLVALHLAIQALRRKECGIALCAGVNAIHHPRNLIVFSQANMLSADGRCKTFDDSADGYGRSEGCATVVLRRVSDALRDGNRIIALLRGSSVNQDGESGGLTVPNGTAQELVMRRAISNAALQPGDIALVEAHGTGTKLGDPIEVGAINSVFRESHGPQRPILVSSAKGNIGHTEAAAGMVGVIKAALQIEGAEIFPHIGMHTPSRSIPWQDYIVEVPLQAAAWSDPVRRCLVNSFGFAGTIASVVLEQAPSLASATLSPSSSPRGGAHPPPPVLTLSAKSRKALAGQVESLRGWLDARHDIDLIALASATNRRTHFQHRLATCVPESHAGLMEWLDKQQQALASADRNPGGPPPKLALLFTGQGAQYPGMGAELYARVPAIQQAIDLCDRLFLQELGVSIKAIMFGSTTDTDSLIRQTQYTQPALFALEYAIARYWISVGLVPDCLIGHSIGEVVAACVAGLVSLGDAVRLVAARGRLMQSVDTPGGMLAVRLSEAALGALLARYPSLDFAAINGPTQCVVSGDLTALHSLQETLQQEGIEATRLDVSHAFHSRQMRSIYDRFRNALAGIQFREPDITLISNLTGEVARFEELSDIEYWVRHIGEPVRFAEGIRTLAKRGLHLCLEVGPSNVLCALGKQSAPDQIWMPSLQPTKAAVQSLGQAVVECYKAGLRIDWAAYHRGQSYGWLDLPAYAFERHSHWLAIQQPRLLERETAGSAEYTLLGSRQPPTTGDTTVEYRRQISSEQPSWLADHQVMDHVVFPGAGYVETLIAAQLALFGEHAGAIGGVTIHEPLYLDATPLEYATLCVPQTDGSYSVRIVSRLTGKSERIARLHVSATLYPAGATRDMGDDLSAHATNDLAVSHQADDLYPLFESIGLRYGETFQGLRRVRTLGQELAIGELDATAHPGEFLSAALLDAAMQSLATLVPPGKTYLPVSFDSIQFHKQPRGPVHSVLRRHQPDRQQPPYEAQPICADLLLLEGKRPVCILRGLKLTPVEAPAVVGRQLYHELVWKKRALVGQATSASLAVLAIVADKGRPELLRNAASQHGLTLYCCTGEAEAAELLRRHGDIKHLVYHWQPGARTWPSHYEYLLTLVKVLDRREFVSRELRLWLVTELAQIVEPNLDAASAAELDMQAASVWGFGHTLLNEYPRWRTTLIDLPDTSQQPHAWLSLMQEIAANAGEHLVAYRNGNRHVRRILARNPTLPGRSDDFELRLVDYGLFEHIKPVTVDVPLPAPQEVQVAIRAAGINFKDVLNALGLLKRHSEELGIEYVPLPLGFEASGEVVNAGTQSGFQVGEEVMLSHVGCFRSRLNVPAEAVVRKPTNLSHAQAAAIPTAYITAYYALHDLAGIRAGDRVLIHAAAGGVGQAAVQLARLAGAEVFATASPQKWPLLRAQGVQHLMSSRSLDFSREVLAATKGEGVDIVLNSLNNDYIPANLDCLRRGGRFIELGKIGIWDQQRVADYRGGISYFNFDLSELRPADLLRLNKRILETVTGLLSRGKVRALPTTVYEVDDVEEAFGVLSRGANTGKLVIKLTDPPAKPEPLDIDAGHTYLITGGFGALGRALADKLVELGARHIALCGRRLPDAAALENITNAWPADARLHALTADVTHAPAVAELFTQLALQAPPLGGVFHAAGVLADAPVKDQDIARFQTVFAPKVAGTAHLLEALTGSPAFFVGFSSIASVLGSSGQGNYAAANAYIDHRLQCEAASGRRCLSVNWGPWAQIGMAAGLGETLLKSIEDRGIALLKPKDALRALFRRLPYPGAQCMIGEFDWPRYVDGLPLENPLFSLLGGNRTRERARIDLEALTAAAPSERRASLLEFLRARMAEVLRFDDAQDIEPDARLADLGLDSLVAIELKNSLESTLRVALPTSLVFDYPSIPALIDYLTNQLWPQRQTAPAAQTAVGALTEADVDRELEALIKSEPWDISTPA